jgi:hypothetical protein
MPISTSFLAPPDLLSLFAVAAAPDLDLAKGTHLRIVPSPILGLPIAPFCVWRMNSFLSQPAVFWHDAQGPVTGRPDLDAARGELFAWISPPPIDQGRLIGLEPIPVNPEGFSAALLSNIGNRLMVARRKPKFQVASPLANRLRLRGRGPIETLRSFVVSPDLMLETIIGHPSPDAILSLPIDTRPWYAAGQGRDPSLKRVSDGAPLRYGPPDRPDGPLDPLDDVAERSRFDALSDSVDKQLDEVFRDPATIPSAIPIRHELAADLSIKRPWQAATFSGVNALLLEAMDPAIARYLGLMTRIDSLPADPSQPDAWIAAGVFLVDLAKKLSNGILLSDLLGAPDQIEMRILQRMMAIFPELARIAPPANTHFQLRVLVAPALAPPPPDPLESPLIRLGSAQWIREEHGVSERFRQQFLIDEPPLAGLAALARQEDGTWKSRHAALTLAPGSDPATRSAPMFPGQKSQAVAAPTGLIVDADVPANGTPWTYRIWLADLFGRFGAPAEFPVPLPVRQGPPRPVMQTLVHPAPAAAGDGLAPFGTLEVRIQVPLAENLTAGALPLSSLEVTVDATTQTPAVVEDTVATLIFDLPALARHENRRLTISARFFDTAGTASATEDASISITDPRPPKIIPTGPALIWTSRPGPSADVELKLAWQGIPGHRYRAYLADAQGIGVATSDGAGPHSRAQIGVDGAALARGGALDRRDRFRLLTDPPLQAAADGTVTMDEFLPRTLSTVQFLRVIATSDNGVEAPFAQAGLIPIAVPTDRRQPPPRLQIVVDPDTGTATVTILAVGMNLVDLRAQEPGLFTDPPDPAAHAPEFRLRRAASAVGDPIYAREVARGFLRATTVDGATMMTAIIVDATAKPLEPFVAYAYWAEIRMPAEKRIPVGVIEIPEPAGAHGISPAQEADATAAFSLPSPPAQAMRVPLEPAVLDAGQITVTTTAGAAPNTYLINLAVSGAPTTVANAIGSYAVRLWRQEADGAIVQAEAGDLTLDNGSLSWSSAALRFVGAIPAVTLHLLLVDPLGRSGAVTAVVAIPS